MTTVVRNGRNTDTEACTLRPPSRYFVGHNSEMTGYIEEALSMLL